jgi:hypothetical protein
MEETNDYVLIQSKKLAEIKYKALQKRSANLERPLSEASIEATAVIEVINYIYENNEWFDIHNRSKSDKTGYQQLRYTKIKIIEKEVEKISEDEARIREILKDPSSVFVGLSAEGLHVWINQAKKYYIEPELNRINRIQY